METVPPDYGTRTFAAWKGCVEVTGFRNSALIETVWPGLRPEMPLVTPSKIVAFG